MAPVWSSSQNSDNSAASLGASRADAGGCTGRDAVDDGLRRSEVDGGLFHLVQVHIGVDQDRMRHGILQ